MNDLQQLLGLDPETGAHRKSYMLRRIAQRALLFDRGISMAAIAREVGVSREWMRLYFEGTRSRRTSGNFEERVEAAIERISRAIGFTLPEADERVIPDIITADLMRAPSHGKHHISRHRRTIRRAEVVA